MVHNKGAGQVPTRAIGFIKVGQDVSLRYDAFPYQKFGAHEGKITSIDRAVVTQRDTRLPIEIKGPVYRVTVVPANQDVEAYGEGFPLQPGMQLEADIKLEERRLLDWLLEPINTVRKRN